MKRVYILLILIMSCISLMAQTLAKNDPLKFDADYYMMEKDFTKALNNYKNILRSEPDNADVKYKIGICYLNSENEKDQAIPFLEEASLKISEKYNSNSFDETNAPADALFLLGSAYRVNNQLDKAVEYYKKYRTYLDPKDNYNLNVVDQYIKSCELAVKMQQSPIEVTLSNLGSAVNNEFPNYNAVLSGDGKTMFYTSPARQGYDIFLTTFQDSAWTPPRNVTSSLGGGKYMRTSDLSYDGSILLLTLDDAINSDIYICRFNKGKWSKAEPLGKDINSKFNETHASLSNDSRLLYFTSDRKGGHGDLDIYKAEADDKGQWSKPVNLGPLINTPLNEETPFLTEIGDKLYFSSEGHNGIGGYDIYYYDFSNPSEGVVNIGFPLNTTDNDLFFVPTGDGHTAYYSLKGEDSRGGRDIYMVYIPEQRLPELPVTDQEMIVSGVSSAESEIADPDEPAESAYITEPVETDEINGPAETAEIAEPAETLEITQSAEPVEIAEIVETVDPVEPAEVTLTVQSKYPEAGSSSYCVQIMALRKPVDLSRFKGLSGVMISRNGDKWYRYSLGNTTSQDEAQVLLTELKSKGYQDAFIKSGFTYPLFTIQVMALPGPVVNLDRFSDLSAINVRKGSDIFCRYTTGEFSTKEEAIAGLGKIKELGYKTAFITVMK